MAEGQVIAILLAAAVMLGAAQQAAAQDRDASTALVRGKVVAADTGSPLRDVRVTLMPVPTADANGIPVLPVVSQDRVVVARNGTFEFRNVAPGRYEIQASPSDASGGFVAPANGLPFDVPAQQRVVTVDVRLRRGGVIAGRVTDSAGTPLTRMTVYALAVSSSFTGRIRRFTAPPTNDLGEFRIYGLDDGEFLVCAETGAFMSSVSGIRNVEPPESLVPTFYPSTTSEDAARHVRIRSGGEIRGIEIRVVDGRRARITGVLIDADGAPLPRTVGFVTRLAQRMGSGTASAFTTDQLGRFEVRDLTPGNYRLTAVKSAEAHVGKPARPMEVASVPLAITGTDVDTLVVRTARGAILRGELEFDPPLSDPLSQRVSVTIGNPDGSCMERSSLTAFAGDDHTFEVGDLFCAYLVRADITGYVVKSVVLNGSDIANSPHRFETGDRVTVALTSHTSAIEGTVVDDAGVPVRGCDVLAFAQDPADWVGNATTLHRATCDGKGRFRLTQLLSGRYLVVAAEGSDLVMPLGGGTEFFEELSRVATAIAVGEDEHRTVELGFTVRIEK